MSGRSPAHGDLVRPGVVEALLEDVREEQSASDPWVWIDRLERRTAAALDLEGIRAGADFSAELVRISEDLAGDPEALRGLVDEIVAPLSTTVPGYRPEVDSAVLLEQARDIALDQLLAGGDDR